MKLRESQRSRVAECIARLMVRRHLGRAPGPKVYIIKRARGHGHVWGTCYWTRGYIVLHIGPGTSRREQYILLCHEVTHWIVHHAFPRRRVRTHGEEFQLRLWRVIPRRLWARASTGQWIGTRSAHRPEFQYNVGGE